MGRSASASVADAPTQRGEESLCGTCGWDKLGSSLFA